MTEDQLLPAWSYELAAVLEVLNELLVQGAEVGVLEEKITEVINHIFYVCFIEFFSLWPLKILHFLCGYVLTFSAYFYALV